MMRLALAFAAVLLGCAEAPPADRNGDGRVPYADAPGTALAPAAAPTPSPRGVAPAVSGVSRLYPAGRSAGAGGVAVADAGPVGLVCGDARVLGRAIGAIRGGAKGCGIASPVRVTSISGVALSSPIRVNCQTASRVADWLDKGAKPSATRIFSEKLASIRPVASYACRTRNSRRGARLSEHAKGNAVDIAAFTLASGKTISVLANWRGGGRPARFLRSAWKSACGPFGTVLGPESDRHHQDHFHFDIARHRGGAYCR